MVLHGDDTITRTLVPTPYDDVGLIDYDDMNLLFFYSVRSTNIEDLFAAKQYSMEGFASAVLLL